MPLAVGTKLGPYEIVEPIGAGGMGEVYRATDPRMRRDVAIKISAERFSDRFSREVHAVAALNHPNICTLYDVGPNYLVMELIEGETLAERIQRGPIPIGEALAIASKIAAALEAAHEKGIVHRDLKPANIKIKPDGTVKVLDFGLAKTIEAQAAASPDVSPTISMGATQAGLILGTAAYMAPEQARGKVVDKRADIWAFGVVVYEMLTAKRLFQGEDLTETLAAVVKQTPDLRGLPEPARRLIERCIEKDPKKRLRDIGDMDLLLAPAPIAPSRTDRTSALLAAGFLAVGVLAVTTAIALWAPWRAEKPADLPLLRLDVDLGANISLPAPFPSGSSVAISPDGTRLAYVSGAPPRLFTRRLDQIQAAELPGTQGAMFPVFSPDGQWVAFLADGKLNKISVEGGAVVQLMEGKDSFGGAGWAEDGSVIVSDGSRGLLRIAPAGGSPETIAAPSNGEIFLLLPQALPGSKAVLFSAINPKAGEEAIDTIQVLTLADRRRKIVARGGRFPRYLAAPGAPGHLVYVKNATMFAIPFDLDKLETHGTAVPVLDDVAYDLLAGTGQFNFSQAPSGHGTLVYLRTGTGGASKLMTLQWIDSTGKKEPLGVKPGIYDNPSLSSDGKRVALQVFEEGKGNIWIYDPQRDAMTRLTFGAAVYDFPIWSPDGRYIVFMSYGNGLFQARADGAGQVKALIESKARLVPCAFTPDAKRLVYDDFETGKSQIWTAPLEDRDGQLNAGKPEQFLKSGFADYAQAFSPDGRWLAYSSNESGKYEVYVRAFPMPDGPGGKWQISNGGGARSVWSRSGHDLLYQSGDRIMAASYAAKGDTFEAEKPRVWAAKLGAAGSGADIPGAREGTLRDLAADGKRVLVMTLAESPAASKPEHEVVFLQNFFDYLHQKAPLK